MCGIVGIAGTRDVAPIILEALKRLEYRGYDSAGIATLDHGAIERRAAIVAFLKVGYRLTTRAPYRDERFHQARVPYGADRLRLSRIFSLLPLQPILPHRLVI